MKLREREKEILYRAADLLYSKATQATDAMEEWRLEKIAASLDQIVDDADNEERG